MEPTNYSRLYDTVNDELQNPRFRGTLSPENTVLVVDDTQVGAPLRGLLLQPLELDTRSIVQTEEALARKAGDAYLVPTKHLLSTVQLLADTRRLIANRDVLAHAFSEPPFDARAARDAIGQFQNELQRMEPSPDPLNAGAYGDLVLATAIAAWIGELDAEAIPEPYSPAGS